MLDAFYASPSVGSLRAEPLSVGEIDAHPDSNRIWATIRAMQIYAAQEISDAEVDRDDIEDNAAAAQEYDDRVAVRKWSESTIDQLKLQFPHHSDVPAVAWLLEKIESAAVDAL